ncbi:hypothetical protein HNP84_000116 [Thermocatellispora tengchongensis]|uniref:Uncharacterized protein n=1 Tax=Thermocatellispora tengchongensis TaxID=1073253 RepID=A0A840NS80_9ACTN|nr:hypothetical protein [Thermocatellispora tengchongensis]MBB5130428.1 hypothetical protein [Thermocatellispora tengchongensis]
MQVKKVLGYSGAGFVAFLLFNRPGDAATAVKGAVETMYNAADSLARFVAHLS